MAGTDRCAVRLRDAEILYIHSSYIGHHMPKKNLSSGLPGKAIAAI